jgi:hypothetical protein
MNLRTSSLYVLFLLFAIATAKEREKERESKFDHSQESNFTMGGFQNLSAMQVSISEQQPLALFYEL